MKLLITCLFLGLSFVMMSSSFAQSDDLLAAIEKQTKAIEKQTKAIKEQTIAMKAIAVHSSSFAYDINFITNSYEDINHTITIIKRREGFGEE